MNRWLMYSKATLDEIQAYGVRTCPDWYATVRGFTMDVDYQDRMVKDYEDVRGNARPDIPEYVSGSDRIALWIMIQDDYVAKRPFAQIITKYAYAWTGQIQADTKPSEAAEEVWHDMWKQLKPLAEEQQQKKKRRADTGAEGSETNSPFSTTTFVGERRTICRNAMERLTCADCGELTRAECRDCYINNRHPYRFRDWTSTPLCEECRLVQHVCHFCRSIPWRTQNTYGKGSQKARGAQVLGAMNTYGGEGPCMPRIRAGGWSDCTPTGMARPLRRAGGREQEDLEVQIPVGELDAVEPESGTDSDPCTLR